MTIRTLIVGDAASGGPTIRSLLGVHSDFEILGETRGREAPAAASKLKPDLLFIDVDIQGMDGVYRLRHLKLPRVPEVVLVSSRDEYAVKAFDMGAVDYLVKPFSQDRFNHALGRVRERNKAEQSHSKFGLLGWLQQSVANDQRPDRIVIKVEGRILLLETSKVEWVEAYGDYVKVHAGKQTHLTRDRMRQVESKLPPVKFLRIHRSTIVNLDFVTEFRPARGGDYRLILRDGTQLRLSRGYRHRIQASSRILPPVTGIEVPDPDVHP